MNGLRRVLAAALAASLAGCVQLPRIFRDRDPLTADEHARLGAAYEAQGEKKAADAQYLRAVALDRRHEGAWMALGNRAYEEGDFDKARRCYLRVLSLAPRHPGASNNLAMVYLAQDRRLEEAEALAKDALAREGPLKPYLLDTLAQIHKRRGEREARAR
ncbi:MAG: tetratricopeptide repeat protein [Elusimicrobia bacterium]|nr:tetratricopeptide repeat protein [Elusimicrobiota bacterium]